LQAKKIPFEEREYGKNPLSESELRELIAGEPVENFLNPRNALYRERNMKQKPPSREEALKLILKEPNLLRRRVIVKGNKKILGFNEAEAAKLF
jgi:arsenate reductase-like glutaredoxin family protein